MNKTDNKNLNIDKNIDTNKEVDNKINEIIGDYKYGFKTETENVYNTGKGLSREIVAEISKYKGEPEWMLDIRLKAYDAFVRIPNPNYGPDLSFIDFDDYTYYKKESKQVEKSWDEVPEKIKSRTTI